MMIHSLRFRLLLLMGVVVVIPIILVALFSSKVTELEYERLGIEEIAVPGPLAPRLDGCSRPLIAWHGVQGGWEGVDSLLVRLADTIERGSDLLLLDSEGRFLGASKPRFADASIQTREDGGLLLEWSEGPQRQQINRIDFLGPRLELVSDSGVSLGILYLIPMPAESRDAETTFIGSVNRWLLWGVVAIALFALLSAWILLRRLLRPIGELTSAARAMEKGDLTRRVRVPSKDEIGELAASFNAMADARERIEELRRNMVTDVAHELRTPVTNLRCQIEALQDGLRQPDPKTFDALHEEVMLLNHLIEDLQTLAIADAGRLDVRPEPISIPVEVARAVRRWHRPGGSDMPDLLLDIPESATGFADPIRLRQIIGNLVENAMDHTPPEGTVTIRVRVHGNEIEIRVSDTGKGVPPDELPRIFERFHRVDRSRDRATGGAGLGLTIVRQLVVAHGGRVWAESEPGTGTAVVFTIPASSRGDSGPSPLTGH